MQDSWMNWSMWDFISERCISSVQELNEDSIEFSLSTWIRSRVKCYGYGMGLPILSTVE